uniref:Vacuolar protein sorting-associated protein 51 homolog n=1 Tax=Chrysotila carterae TaxID=13221 RepID=A0A7S4BEI0_CHRCT
MCVRSLELRCEMINLRADSMAKHLVNGMYNALQAMARAATAPSSSARDVLLRAGLCMHMAAAGVAQVPTLLKSQLSPHGLGGAALGFDGAAMTREMGRARDALMQSFVEMQAQKLSRLVSERVSSTNWLVCPAPRAVTGLVQLVVSELRQMQTLAAQLFPAEPVRALLPQGPFPAASSVMQLVQQRTRQSNSSSSAITKDLQRMFTRKISFGASEGKATLAGMLTHVTKLALKTMLEEVRVATFGCAGFQQVQVDCSMLRWVLAPTSNDEEAVLALLDEIFISCQDRCLDCVPMEQPVVEALCESERQRLLLSLA